ncbi:hypothetical protein BAE44_0008142 [Dichanthelium oligosanthes]|uniref:Disease resistance protein At4g27190-like leucine-rich repeats domain-containing protein n=1 Tax=Dichanthelium oligosanthes TaxID=888268 RepID=A0A1E5W0D9_9POAL|nr:hypothetical protein BAE44_0008142 [Dichanthelium oligosanthes]
MAPPSATAEVQQSNRKITTYTNAAYIPQCDRSAGVQDQVIQADTIDAAVERILDELKDNTSSRSSRENVIYFDGWDGLGASAVLQGVAQRLGASASKEELARAGLHFEKIIHIDCTKWQSRRAMQRLIAQQLGLAASVMDVLNQQDEEDSYNGADLESRDVILQVIRETYQSMQNRRFLVLFHNGSSDEIDLVNFGFPLQDSGFHLYPSKVLWTLQGSFRLKPRMEVERVLTKSTGMTGVFLVAASRHEKQDPHVLWSYLVRQEAVAAVARNDTCRGTIGLPARVSECFLYELKLCGMGRHFMMDYDLATHRSNYWICDGIILPQEDRDVGTDYDDVDGCWREADALQREMQLDVDYHRQHLPYHLVACAEITPCWTSPTYGIIQILDGATHNGGMFQHFDKIAVLKLSRCTFSFSSPPFLCCHNLRFLWLDHCQDQVNDDTDRAAEAKEEDVRRCFQRLWVLDVRYTRCDRILSARMLDLMDHLRELNVKGAKDLDMGSLQGRLANIRKLRVKGSTVSCSCSENGLFLDMNKMELLEFSGNRTTMQGGVANLSEISTSSNRLETLVIIDGCAGIRKISFRGCAELKNLLLSGLFEDLCILDLSGTAVKTLDLSAMTARGLDELLLNDCEKLCAILWPPEGRRKTYLHKLHIDTTWSAASLSVAHGGRVPSEFYWCISVRDTRFLRSLVRVKEYFFSRYVNVEIFTPAIAFGSGKDGGAVDSRSSNKKQQQLVNLEQRPKDSSTYVDIADSFGDHNMPLLVLQESESDGDAPTLTRIWPCPRIPSSGRLTCYMHIQDHQPRRTDESPQEGGETSISIPDIIGDHAEVLHVHDSFSITSIQGSSRWYYLSWCRVERCPKLKCVFTTPRQLQESSDIVYLLETLWVSQLPEARFVWDWRQFGNSSLLHYLTLLHLDLCPRVIHVLPVHYQGLSKLMTLEIVWCGDLRDVFPLYTDAKSDQHQQQKSTTVEFQNLKRIHLHEVPKLQGICGGWRMSAPKLETVKIRGCWSLKRLPAVSRSSKSKKVECDCEKEWWDKLEWDGLDVDHHPSLYKPTHSRYYKKTMLRGSVLI